MNEEISILHCFETVLPTQNFTHYFGDIVLRKLGLVIPPFSAVNKVITGGTISGVWKKYNLGHKVFIVIHGICMVIIASQKTMIFT